MRWTGSVEDRLAIRELIEDYDDAVFRRDGTQWGSTWAADAIWSIGGREVRGREAIVKLWTEFMDQYPFVGLYLTGGGCALGERTGEGRWYVLDVGVDHAGKDLCVHGRYDDRYAKGDDGLWRFASRRYEVLHMPAGSAAAVPRA
jgi:hypothetical protein